MVNRGVLPVPERISPADPILQRPRDTSRDRTPNIGESAPWVVRTALCVEPRDGRLYVFMPPLPNIENYLDLVTASISVTILIWRQPLKTRPRIWEWRW